MAISILNYYEQPDGKNLMIMADDLYERNPGEAPDDNMPMDPTMRFRRILAFRQTVQLRLLETSMKIKMYQFEEHNILKKIQLRIGAIKKSISGNRRMGNYDYIK